MNDSTASALRTIISRGYRLILLSATMAGFQVFDILLDIKKQGIDWLDHSSTLPLQWYILGLFLVGNDYLLRTAHNIPLSWQPPHLLRTLVTGFAIGWVVHLGFWLVFGR